MADDTRRVAGLPESATVALTPRAAAAVPAFRLPSEPYPGLRPFLDHESPLLFGRSRQVREVIDHLRETQFVAVIGGSGSGKSSLIHAGVVPELRSFGIPGAGDFWVPMVCIPGTNPAEPRPGKPTHTPITRLAWKFAKLLKTRGSPEADAARVDEIAALFRQDAGFTRLVDGYAGELDVPPGPDAHDARLLFVIDQFEELFHFTNKGNDDARRMVERVIDHFFDPHPRCYVVLTMRSEHLNDCASYLELPDAINKSSYLVRRLDDDELREAIEMPAQRLLRLLQRQKSADRAALPDEIAFDPRVLERLLRDARAITHDPDHLPLLQHLLARVWEVACRRERVAAGGVPTSIGPADLVHAVLADGQPAAALADLPGEPSPASDAPADDGELLDPRINVLRAGVENWAEAVFRRHLPAQQKRLESLLRRLAFKDPNTGQYTQQRVDVDDPRLFDDDPEPSSRAALWQLIQDPQGGRAGPFGLIGSVDYLFWDDENPKRVTLKVSHESFIRGWSRFRSLVDKEAERFDAFVELLQRCARWATAGRPGRLLLESADLDRLREEKLDAVLTDAKERASWFKVLRLDRDGPRLVQLDAEVDGFIAQSQARNDAEAAAEREAAEREREFEQRARRDAADKEVAQAAARQAEAEAELAQVATRQAKAETERANAVVKKNAALIFAVLLVALGLLPYAAFTVFVQTPVMHSVEKYAEARTLIERRDRSESNPVAGAAGRELGVLLQAGDKVEQAKAGVAFLDRPRLRGLLDWLSPVTDAKRLLAMSSSEPGVNGSLRDLLTTNLWRSGTAPGRVDASLRLAPARREVDCRVALPGSQPQSLVGSLFLDVDAGRGLFVPVPARGVDEAEIAFYAASLADGRCGATQLVWSVPRYLQPLVLLDARVRHLAVALQKPPSGPPSVSLYTVAWQVGADGQSSEAVVKFRSVVTDQTAVDRVKAEIDAGPAAASNVPEVKSVATWREDGGIGVTVADRSWRLFSETAQRLPAPGPAANWEALSVPDAGSACDRLAALLRDKVQPGFTAQMLQGGGHCFQIQRGNPLPSRRAAAAAAAAAAAMAAAVSTSAASAAAAAETRSAALAASPSASPSKTASPAGLRDQVLVIVYPPPRGEGGLESTPSEPPTSIANLVNFGRHPPGAGSWLIGKAGPYDGWVVLRRPRESDGSPGDFGAPWSTAALLRLGRQVYALSSAAAASASR